VHERLAKVRCYQLSHPAQATEAMNRLAQAFMCLTDPQAKRAYDGTLGLGPRPVTVAVADLPRPKPSRNKAALTDTSVGAQTQLDWSKIQAPPPVRGAAAPSNGSAQTESAQTASAAVPSTPSPATLSPATPVPANEPEAPVALSGTQAAPLAEPVDSVYEIALSSFEAKRGLGTARGLYERVFFLRQLHWAWQQAGKCLTRAKRPAMRPAELKGVVGCLHDIHELMDHFPKILGRPGQPGYRVVALARLGMTESMLQTLDSTQREALARDWVAGMVVLKAHRQFLRKELKRWRRQGRIGKAMRAVRAALNDHPILVCMGVAAVALLLAWWFVFLLS